MEEAALGHGASGTVEAVANRTTSLVHDGPAFLIYAVDYGKMTEGVDDICSGGMGAGGAADNRREKAEALVWFFVRPSVGSCV